LQLEIQVYKKLRQKNRNGANDNGASIGLVSETAGPEPKDAEVTVREERSSGRTQKEVHGQRAVVKEGAQLRRRIINLALPALVEQTLMTLVSMADMIMVGRLGPWAITSVGLSNQPMFVAFAVFISLNVGATALVARFVGAGKPEEASKVARQALMLAAIMGAVLGAIGFIAANKILLWMGAQSDVIGPGTAYLKVVCSGIVFMAGWTTGFPCKSGIWYLIFWTPLPHAWNSSVISQQCKENPKSGSITANRY